MSGSRRSLFLCLLVLVLVAPARADTVLDYCTDSFVTCREFCVLEYAPEEWGDTFINGWRANLCLIECDIAYVGCLTRRFRQG